MASTSKPHRGRFKAAQLQQQNRRFVTFVPRGEPVPVYALTNGLYSQAGDFTPSKTAPFVGTALALSSDGRRLVVDAARGIGVPVYGEVGIKLVANLLKDNLISAYGALLDTIAGSITTLPDSFRLAAGFKPN